MASLEDNLFDEVDTRELPSNGDKNRTSTVDLEDSLLVDISDALSEKDKVKFTIHTKTSLRDYQKPEFSVVRQHEEFRWLHDRFIENPDYAGLIIPPPPPKPNFDASREKLQRLSEGEGSMTKDEFIKMKAELEAEYLATFKKTVAMHEVFLQRLAAQPSLRLDLNFMVFLEFSGDLSVRLKNSREKVGSIFQKLSKAADEMFLKNQTKDSDEFFEQEKLFLVEYHSRIKDATNKADRLTKAHKHVADCHIRISTSMSELSTIDNTELDKVFRVSSDAFEKLRKIEGRMASDMDLKLSDTLRYYSRDSTAAKDLLYRRMKCLSEYEAANKALDKARTKGKDVAQVDTHQHDCKQKFDSISETARHELQEFKDRRLKHFKKNFVDLAELQVKQAKLQVQLLRNTLIAIRDLD